MWDYVWTVEDFHNWNGNTLQFPFSSNTICNAKETNSNQMFSLTWCGSETLPSSIIFIKFAD